MHENDGGHRLLFAHPRMIESLVREFVPEEWVEKLDFTTLERVNASFITKGRMKRREGDMVWRVLSLDGEPVYLYLLVEFQSTVDRFMVVRLMCYVSLLYQDLIERGELTPDGGLPLVIPLVAYNGDRGWSAPQCLSELIRPPFPGAEAYLPELRYRVIDESGYTPEELESRGSLAPLLFWLGTQEPEVLRKMPSRLREVLAREDDPSLYRAFLTWVFHLAGFDTEKIPELLNLEEFQAMWDKTVQRWQQSWVKEGRKEGWQEGRQEGRKEGEEALLVRQLERKFGPLDRATRARVHRADADRLLEWGERILTAERLEQVFAD